MASISYAITVCNEDKELDRLLLQLTSTFENTDEIVILSDEGNTTLEVMKVIERYIALLPTQIKHITHPLNNNFAAFKNFLKLNCTKSYVFFVDADETLHPNLAAMILQIIHMNEGIDMIAVPRVNVVQNITQDHIARWGWRVDERGWINWPDFQLRVCRNTPDIKWENKVHEKLVGWKTASNLPFSNDEWALLHFKTIERQEKQNNFYSII